jgi:hypothetical protein
MISPLGFLMIRSHTSPIRSQVIMHRFGVLPRRLSQFALAWKQSLLALTKIMKVHVLLTLDATVPIQVQSAREKLKV